MIGIVKDLMGVGDAPSPKPHQVNTTGIVDPNATNKTKQQLVSKLGASQNREAPTMSAASRPMAHSMSAAQVGSFGQTNAANIDQAQQAQFRNRQMALANALSQQAAGQGPSVAGMQLRESTDRGLKQAMAMAASQRGLNPMQQARMAGNAQAQIQSDAGRAAAQMRVQEQLNAQNALGNVLAGARGQDIGLATNQAQFSQQANMANFQGGLQAALANAQMDQQARMQNNQFKNQARTLGAQFDQQARQQNLAAALATQGQRDQMAQFYNNALLGVDQNDRNANLAIQQLLSQNLMGSNQLANQQYQADTQLAGNILGGFGSGLTAWALK